MSSRAGAWVEVRSKEEILATLDAQGRLENMPFMPEMFAFCGQRLQVSARAHKTCDTLSWTGNRSLENAVHLEGTRCDGAAHAGCHAACLLFWKEAWLKPADGPAPPLAKGEGCTEEAVRAAVRADDDPATGEERYRCQATDLLLFTAKLRNLDPRQYVRDLTSGNVGPAEMVRTFSYFGFNFVFRPMAPKWGAPFRSFYNSWQKLWGGMPYPHRPGTAPKGKPQPVARLGLKAGELVRVKSHEEILKTLDAKGKNRGMLFDGEMVPFCGGVFRVRSSVDTFVEEQTGRVRKLKTPAVILENVWCRSHYSDRRLFCRRAIYSWWREAWLERAEEGAEPSTEGCSAAREIATALELAHS